LFLKEVVTVLSPRVPRDLAGRDSNFDSRPFGYCAEWLVIVCEYPQVISQLSELLSTIFTELLSAPPSCHQLQLLCATTIYSRFTCHAIGMYLSLYIFSLSLYQSFLLFSLRGFAPKTPLIPTHSFTLAILELKLVFSFLTTRFTVVAEAG
jgi:hypothetical protein